MTGQTGSNAARVGILVIIATVLLYAAFVFLGGRMGSGGAVYHVRMLDAGGVVQGTRVSMAGVQIGEVSKVRLIDPRLVMIDLIIDPKIRIPDGSVAQIPTQFISIGEAGMVIMPPDKIGANLPVGSTMEGRHPGPLEGIFPDTKTTIQTVNNTLAALQSLLRDEDLKGNIKHLLVSTNKTMNQFELLAQRTTQTLGENQAPINAAMKNAALAMADVHKSTNLVYRMLREGHYSDQIASLMKHVDATSEKAGKLIDSLNAFVSDPDLHNSLKATLANAQELSNQGKQIATKTNAIADNGVELSKRAVALTDQASQIATEAKGLVVKLEGLVDKVEGKVDGFNPKFPRNPIGPIHAEVRALRDTRPNYNRIDANLKVPILGQDVYLGLFDAFGSNKLNLQLGKRLGSNGEFRYGAYAGTLGLGVDYRLAPRLGFSADVFNANKPRFDALGKYDFGNGYVSWFGFDRIFDRNGFTIGIGIER